MRGFHELMSLQDSLTLNSNFSNNNLPLPPLYSDLFHYQVSLERKPESTGWILKNLEIEARS
jgi:hypothetical protein